MIDNGRSGQYWLPTPEEAQLSNEEVHVWRISVKPLTGQVPQLTELLSNNERSRANAFVQARDRERFIISHGILRILIGCYLEIAPGKLQFSQGSHTKPHLEGSCASNRFQFNLSHSQEYAMFAFTRQRQIGVDIESIRPLPDLDQIASNTFSPQEIRELEKTPPEQRLAAFYNYWVRKEAFVKALGKGLFYPLNHFSVSISSEKQNCFLNIDDDPAEAACWDIVGLKIADGYAAALAVEGHDWRLTIRTH